MPYPLWQDQIPDLGPLGGISSCLQRAAYEAVFFVACDYPMMTTECMDFLIGQMEEEDDCVIPVVNGRIHPVCAVIGNGFVRCWKSRSTMENWQ